MARNDEEIHTLQKAILDHETELALLKSRLSRAESQGLLEDDAVAVRNGCTVTPPDRTDLASDQIASGQDATRGIWSWPLSKEEYKRYGRQMIMPEIGLEGKPHNRFPALSGLTKYCQVN